MNLEQLISSLPEGWWRAALSIVLGLPVVRILAGITRKTLNRHSTPQNSMLGYRLVLYVGFALFILMALTELGFHLSTLYGAAGITGVAIGFASQTSLSNLISGLFLIMEKPFQVEDVIKVGGTTGVVIGIDLLSTKLRTFDNMYVRIPNQTLVNNEFTNITRFPIRRMDISIGVDYKEDIGRVIRILREIANDNPYSLDEPEPLVIFKGFGESSLDFTFGIWFAKADILLLRNSIHREIKERFDAEGISIPYPHRTLYVGEQSKPFPVTVLPPEKAG
jgi:small-conductance mechanosensitive channel